MKISQYNKYEKVFCAPLSPYTITIVGKDQRFTNNNNSGAQYFANKYTAEEHVSIHSTAETTISSN